MERNFNPEKFHKEYLKGYKPLLSYNDGCDYRLWREQVKEKYKDIIRKPEKELDAVPEVEYTKEHDDYTEIRYTFESEPGYFVPCHLLIPKNAEKPCPVVICLQGHSTGMHTSIAVDWRDEITPIQDDGDRDFCLECMRRGIIGVAFEQRYMGERSSHPEHKPSCGCLNGGAGATQALLLGRTAIGERVYDVDRLIDYLLTRPEIDSSELGIMGGSGGGTTTMFAGAMLSRLKYIMPAVSFSSFRASIGSMYHCECNYIPGLLNFGESADVTGLCAPKKLVIVNGRFDSIFPLNAGLVQFERVKNIYRAAGVADLCKMVIGEGGHRFYADIAWGAMLKLFAKR